MCVHIIEDYRWLWGVVVKDDSAQVELPTLGRVHQPVLSRPSRTGNRTAENEDSKAPHRKCSIRAGLDGYLSR